jgi:aryl-alcohol dehydrogenase-like predicted oxidoreductase
MWGNGVGLLGISGKYGEIKEKQQIDCIDFIIKSFDYIDTASVYGESKPINKLLTDRIRKIDNIEPKIINKIGANLTGSNDYQELINEFEIQQKLFFNLNLSAILLHRPSKQFINRDLIFYSYLKERFPNICFGICTNNLEVFDIYFKKMKIDMLQIAINFLDYQNNLKLLKKANHKKVKIFARSCLSSGLLSGKYNDIESCNFTDQLRSRFVNNESNKSILKQRIEAANKIKQFYCSHASQNENANFGSMAQFVYSVLHKLPYIDEVIKGGSSLNQLQDNSCIAGSVSDEIAKKVYNKYIKEWSRPYL